MVKYGDNRVALTDNEYSWEVTGDAVISIYACQPVYSLNNDYSAVLKTLDFGQGEPDVITVSTIESKSVSEMITVIQKLGGTGSNKVTGTTLYKVSGYALNVQNSKYGNMDLYDSQNGNSIKVYGTSATGTGFTLSRSESDPYYSALYTNPKNFLTESVPVVNYDYITMIVIPINYKGTYISYAQASRHRKGEYKFERNSKNGYYIPPIIEDDPILVEEWLHDINSVKENFPLGELLTINERGSFDDFIMKLKERDCSAAQLEIFRQSVDIKERYYEALKEKNHPYAKKLEPYMHGRRCTYPDFHCPKPCGFVDGIKGTRKI
jgi:hypothetical protein